MISIIVCSIDENLFRDFSSSLDRSIGTPYEIIRIENDKENLSISKAYNLGAIEAKNQLLLFVHEDMIFHSKGWGRKLFDHFETLKNVGILGIAGSSYLPISPSDWWLGNRKYLHTNLLSNEKNGKFRDGVLKNSGDLIPKSVFLLDGMFLAMKKSVWEEFPFDESLDGFHGYDTSICLRVSKKYQNYFVPEILIEHFSKGYPNKTWLINTVHAKYSVLPDIDLIRKGQVLDKALELKTYHLFLNQLRKLSDSWYYSFKYSWFYLRNLNQAFFSGKSWGLWIAFQGLFLFNSIKK